MRRLFVKLLIAFLPAHTHADIPRLTKIAKEFEIREQADDTTSAHLKWISTEAGMQDVAFLAENFDRMTDQQRFEIPTELARTGRLAIVPLLERALGKSSNALAGVFFACHLGGMEPGFAKAVAPLLVPWIGKSMIESRDTALMLLPVLDPDLSAKILFVKDFVGEKAAKVHWVLASCNEAGLKVPRQVIDPLLTAWEKPAQDSRSEYKVERGYQEALKALSIHDPEMATQKAEEILRGRPRWSDQLADLPLMAAGLTALYDKLADLDEERFSKLPEAAQFYFAVSYFESDCANGGIDQALRNSTGDYLPLVKKAYQAINDQQGVEWLNWMLKPFGNPGPSHARDERITQMNAMTPSYCDQTEQLRESWNDHHRDDEPQISTSWRLAVYAAKHAAEIRKALALPDP